MKKRHEGSSDSPDVQEMIRQLYMQSTKAVDEEPLVKRKESVQLAIMDAAVSEDVLKLQELLDVEDELGFFLIEFRKRGLEWALKRKLHFQSLY